MKQDGSRVVLSAREKPLATLVLADKEISRPFYANVFAPRDDSTPINDLVTRPFPPQAGIDPTDHADMHPGIWLAFGDLNGHDFWRNKKGVRQNAQVTESAERGDALGLTVRSEYVAQVDGVDKKIATEVCKHEWRLQTGGVLLLLDSEISSADPREPLVFGDQEEMGLGVRVATPLRVKDGNGEIVTEEGNRNEKAVWGKQARWCDYRGDVDGRRIGILLMPHPGNFRPSWFHVRDYGLMVANPFGQNAFTRGEKSRVELKPGEKLRLRFGVWIHSGKTKSAEEMEKSYTSYVKSAGK
jgi:Methane oxygenase PmoA